MRHATFLLLLPLLACGGAEFSEQPYCHSDCDLPHTDPPSVHFVSPSPGDTFFLTTVLVAAATDDKGIDHVQFDFHDGVDWIPLTPAPLQAPPWTVEFGRYADTVRLHVNVQLEVRAIAVDIEGNADTAFITGQPWHPFP